MNACMQISNNVDWTWVILQSFIVSWPDCLFINGKYLSVYQWKNSTLDLRPCYGGATALLRDKLHKPFHRVICRATVKIIARQVVWKYNVVLLFASIAALFSRVTSCNTSRRNWQLGSQWFLPCSIPCLAMLLMLSLPGRQVVRKNCTV